jgi:hypothetical protein
MMASYSTREIGRFGNYARRFSMAVEMAAG